VKTFLRLTSLGTPKLCLNCFHFCCFHGLL